MPDLWKLGAQPGSIGANLDRGVALLVAIGVPSGALAHFVDKTFGGTVYVDGLPFACGAIEHLTRYMPLGEAFRLGSDHTAQFEIPSRRNNVLPVLGILDPVVGRRFCRRVRGRLRIRLNPPTSN